MLLPLMTILAMHFFLKIACIAQQDLADVCGRRAICHKFLLTLDSCIEVTRQMPNLDEDGGTTSCMDKKGPLIMVERAKARDLAIFLSRCGLEKLIVIRQWVSLSAPIGILGL